MQNTSKKEKKEQFFVFRSMSHRKTKKTETPPLLIIE